MGKRSYALTTAARLDLLQPGISSMSFSTPQHVQEVPRQQISGIEEWVRQVEERDPLPLGKLLLFSSVKTSLKSSVFVPGESGESRKQVAGCRVQQNNRRTERGMSHANISF